MNPQHMNMAGMNAAGGPVGGAPMMANGPAGLTPHDNRLLLNTYIYDYFLRNHHYEIARVILTSDLPLNTKEESPSRRDVNGVGDGMDGDSKDDIQKRPDDLPSAAIPPNSSENSFLFDWWGQFWDVFSAHRNKPIKPGSGAVTYLQHQRQLSQMRQADQQQMLNRVNPTMMGNQYRQMMQGMQPNGMMPNELQKRAMQNNRNANPQQLAQMKSMQQQMMQTSMQREGSGMDMGQRPSSPNSGDNAPSPKRQRLDSNTANGQHMGPAGRGQGMQQMGNTSNTAAMAGQMLLQNGITPSDIGSQQFNQFQAHAANPNLQQKSIEVYAQNLAQQQRSAMINQNSGKAMNPAGVPQGSPMTQPNPDGPDMYFPPNRGMQAGPPGNSQGNHALQDYQMQLMLLEQQNKKRLLMARQEQDSLTHGPPGPAPMGQPGFAPAMSPQGSRAGPSPNPNEMKRGTPKMGQTGLPGSPMPDGSMPQNRSSPIGNFNPGSIPPGMAPQQYFAQLQQQSNMMRPPPAFNGQGLTPEQMALMARPENRMPNGAMWQQPPPQMMQPGPGQQPMPMGTPQQRNNPMPPPPAPPGGVQPGGTQPSSPTQQPAAPPTPSQVPKGNPKSKKETKETRKKPNKKNTLAATGATPVASEAEPATPTPATPITPRHPQSFNNQGSAGAPPGNMQAPPPTSGVPPPAVPSVMDPTAAAPFGTMDGPDNGMNMDFGPLDSDNVLENFDFESFLHTDNDMGGLQFENFPFSADGVEAGAGEV
ncbi:hypothetical protein H2201_008066 [Coniosporium apollinis]|uniref:LisH domain-containing protein n=1 Tax=Coniosporium apollinis TaxID=61459 RepID=A0ABQ9NLH7_9PEZI|nr:hypothetical protein H2201_008066 [Coniosporium apollinis]